MNLIKKTYFSLVVLGGISLILIVFGIYPLFKEIKKNSEDFVSQKEELSALKIKGAYLRDFEKIYETQESDLGKINSLFVNQEEPVAFINFLEKIAQDCRVLITITPAAPQGAKTDPWPSLAFQINLIGAFSDSAKFLEKLESGPWLIEILNLTMGRAGEGNVGASFLIKIYAK